MAKFFNTPSDLLNWVKTQNQTAVEAADKIQMIIGDRQHEQDIAESTHRIFAGRHAEHAAEVIFGILSNYDITEATVKQASEKVGGIYAANELLKGKMITAEQHQKMVKEAQIMRQPGQYQMELRVCPKLPASIGHRRISTYNCLHYCNAALTFDDEPNRVFCMESIWRNHIMDKFSRDIRDAKTGHLVGGYIGNRFYSFPDAGTPANPNVPRDGGNPMALKPGERTLQPRPHEWSIERRMQEQREKGSTKSITLGASSNENIKTAGFHIALLKQAEVTGFIKLSEVETVSNDEVSQIFNEAIELHTAGVSSDEAAVRLAQSHQTPVENIVRIQEFALRKLSQHQSDVYMVKTAVGVYSPTTPANTSALSEQLDGGTFTAGDEIAVTINGSQQIIPPGTALTKDPRDQLLFYTPDKSPVRLDQNTVDTKIINSLDTENLGLTQPKKTQHPAQQPAPQQASVPNEAPSASVQDANPNAAPVY